MTLRVLLADDHALVRAGFRMILETEPDIVVCGEAGDGRQAVQEAERLQPDVVLMDIQMPTVDGITATRRITSAGPTPRVLILTTFERDEYVFEALRAGASGFLLKNTRAEELAAGVRIVAGGDALLAPSVTRRMIEEFTSTWVEAGDGDELARLTPREIEVLTLLASGLTNAELARRLIVSEGTVKTHVSSLLAKLGLRDRIQAVVYAYEHGVSAQATLGGRPSELHPAPRRPRSLVYEPVFAGGAPMRVLGIDPGLTRCGYAVVDGLGAGGAREATAVALGVIRTAAADGLPRRLAALRQELADLIAEYRPTAVAVEHVFFQVNVRTAMSVGQASGLALAEAAVAGCAVEQYTPNQVKDAVAGWGGASKAQVQKMVQVRLRLPGPPRPPDAADAAALALCHLAMAPTQQRLAAAMEAQR